MPVESGWVNIEVLAETAAYTCNLLVGCRAVEPFWLRHDGIAP